MLNIIKQARTEGQEGRVELKAGDKPLRLGTSGGLILRGEAWVTVKGVFDDLILREGEALPCCSPDILVEALSAELVLEIGPSVSNAIFSLRKNA